MSARQDERSNRCSSPVSGHNSDNFSDANEAVISDKDPNESMLENQEESKDPTGEKRESPESSESPPELQRPMLCALKRGFHHVNMLSLAKVAKLETSKVMKMLTRLP